MRLLFLGLVIATTAALTIIAGNANAQSLEATANPNTVEVRGLILPNQYITVNTDGEIIQIASNTSQDVAPKVFVNSIEAQNQIPMSDAVLEQYTMLAPKGYSKPGILYQKSLLQQSLQTTIINMPY